MADTGVLYPGTKTTTNAVSPYDDEDWVDVANIGADDAAYCYITSSNFDRLDYSYLIKAQNFGVVIPAYQKIVGIKVEVEKYYANGWVIDGRVSLLDASGNIVGSNKADTSTHWAATPTVITYGGATDMWGTTLTHLNVEDVDFGVAFACRVHDLQDDADAFVDYIRITVYYEPDIATIITEGTPAEAATSVSAYGNISAIGVDNATIRGFDYGADAGYGSDVHEHGDFGVGVFTLNITGLTASTHYHYRAKSYNSAGWSYGADMTFTTPASGEEVLRPNANGDVLTGYEQVDESVADESATIISTTTENPAYWLFNFPSLLTAGTITKIRVYNRSMSDNYSTLDNAFRKTVIKTGGTEYYGNAVKLTTSYTDDYTEYTLNPKDSAAWEAADIAAIQAGVWLDPDYYFIDPDYYIDVCSCTQVWIRVYIEAVTTRTLTVSMDALLRATDTKTINLDTYLRITDDKTVALDTLLRSIGLTETVALDAILGGFFIDIDLDTLLRATDAKTVNLDTYIKEQGQIAVNLSALVAALGVTSTVLLDILLKGPATKTTLIDILLRDTDSLTITLDAILSGSSLKTVALDVIISVFPGAALKYVLEIHEASSGDLLAILDQAYTLNLQKAKNEPNQFNFNLPADDPKKADLTLANEVWLRNYETGTVLHKFRLNKVRDIRQ